MSHFVTKPSDLRHLPYTDYQCVEIVKALRAMDVEADTDDCSLLQAQLIGLMEGEGAPEDHRDVKAALAGMGLTPAGADLVHGCLVNILSAKLFEKSSVLLPVVFPADVPEAAKNMKQNEYRGPLAWTAKVIDFAADYTAVSGAADHSKLLPELLDLIRFQQEYIVAIPSDVAASLPAMPGFDGDWAEGVVERAKAIAASAPVAPTREAEAVRWEFRWLNPANNPCSSPSEMAWKLVEPKGMQPLEAALSDLRACRYAGKPCYEVRPLFAEAAPVAPAPQPVGAGEQSLRNAFGVWAETQGNGEVSPLDVLSPIEAEAAFDNWKLTLVAAAPQPADRWRERWYGSGGVSGFQGWSIVNDRTNALVAYLCSYVSSEAVSEIVMAHNNALLAAAPKAAPTIKQNLIVAREPLQQGEYLPLAVASAPDRIWLDLGFDPKETDADFSDLNTPTWSADNASGHGIEYVRADRAARGAAQAAPAPVAEDASLLDFLVSESLDLRCFSMPTGGDDADIGWRTTQQHMSAPKERVVSEVHRDDPRQAIREAIERIERDPYCTGELHADDAAPVAPPPQPAPLTSSFVQTVPDKCDRIVWRNNYYHLPIAAAPKAAPIAEAEQAAWHAGLDEGRSQARGAAQAAPADVRNLLDYAMQIAHERELHVTGHKHDSEGATASFIAACARAFGTSAAPVPVAEDADDAARMSFLCDTDAIYWVQINVEPDRRDIFNSSQVWNLRKAIDAARAHAAQPEGDAK